MLSRTFVAALACLVGNVVAAPQRPGYPQSSNQSNDSRCHTIMGSSPIRGGLRTAWSTSNMPCITTSFTSTTTTNTPPPVTSTLTSTATVTTTVSTSVSTFTSTETDTATTIITTTSTQTATATATTSDPGTSTSTVPTAAGFTPIQTSLPGSSYSGSSGGSPVVKRLDSGNYGGRSNGNAFRKSQDQPQRVSCVAYARNKCSTKVVTLTSTKQAPAPTVTITTTSNTTLTFVATASTTTTVTTTTTSSSTTTTFTATTTTTTTTLFADTTTVYAACATNNFADSYNGGGFINGDTPGSNFDGATAVATNAYDCCVAALLTPNANNFVFDPARVNCAFAITDTCPTPDWSVQATTTVRYVYGNLPCGPFVSVRPAAA